MLQYCPAGMPDALRKLMQINTAILREISFQVSEGNPHWGLLLANEYLDASGYLHAALFSKFLARFGASYASHPLAKRLKAGARAAELPKYLREQIGERAHRSDKKRELLAGRNLAVLRSTGARRPLPLRSQPQMRFRPTGISPHQIYALRELALQRATSLRSLARVTLKVAHSAE